MSNLVTNRANDQLGKVRSSLVLNRQEVISILVNKLPGRIMSFTSL
jgi:hypothetical protein